MTRLRVVLFLEAVALALIFLLLFAVSKAHADTAKSPITCEIDTVDAQQVAIKCPPGTIYSPLVVTVNFKQSQPPVLMFQERRLIKLDQGYTLRFKGNTYRLQPTKLTFTQVLTSGIE